MTLEIGSQAPDFTLTTDDGGSVALSDLAGKPVVLYFYPRANTPGCTKQACAFNDSLPAFDSDKAVIIGVSKDSVKKLSNFKTKYDLNFALASDAETTTCEDYGVWVEKKMYGKTFMGIERATYLIGPDGKIAEIWRKVKVPGHADEVLEAVTKLQAA
ncbi:MAG: hypothetical protein Alpg2KO_15200 [Alphaproteobacteria bacterium]